MDIEILKNIALFGGMNENEIREAINNLHANERNYPKGNTILYAGSVTDQIGIVLSGSVTIESNDMWGNRTILSHVGEGDLFAETYAILKDEPMLVDAVANENCRVLFLAFGSLQSASPDFTWWNKLIRNLLTISSHKNLRLSGRSFHTSPKTVRGRIQAYLNSAALQKGAREFDIPFNRQQLADYLNLDRTALSKELGKMKKEGIIDYKKSHFLLKQTL